MVVKINKKKIRLAWPRVFYIGTILAYFLYLVRELNYNSAFVDEAIYATVGEEVLRGIYWERAISWMGGSYIYPIISAVLNRYWGLVGIRFFAMISLIIIGLVSSKIAEQLGGTRTRLYSLLLFLSSAASLSLGQLGTYDAPALALTALSLHLAIKSRYEDVLNKKYLFAVASGILLALGILTKYIMVFSVPFIGILIFYRNRKIHLRTTALWAMSFYSILFYFVWMNLTDLVDFFTNSHFSEPASYTRLFTEIVKFLGILIPFTLASLIYTFKRIKGEKKFLAIVLFIAGFAPLIYHLGAGNIRSLWKHLVITSFFWAPLSAWFIHKLSAVAAKHSQQKTILFNFTHTGLTIVFLLFTANLWFNLGEHWRFQRSWPSTSKTVEFLSRNREPDDKIFAEASAIYKFHLFNGFEDPSSWASTWWVEYKGVQGTEAMKMALRDKYYDYVILNGYFTSSTNQEIDWDLKQNYKLVMKEPYSVAGKYSYVTTVWAPKNKNEFSDLLGNNL